MIETEFQDKVLKGVEALDTKFKTAETQRAEIILAMQGEVKKAFEELTKAQKAINDHDALIKGFKRVELEIRREQRSSFGSPVQRVQRDPELNLLFNALIRNACLDIRNSEKLQERWAKPLAEHMGAFEAHQKALGEDSSPGSTLIITQLFKEIYDTLAMYGQWNTLGVRRLGTKTTNFPVKTARALANWLTTEAGTISDDTTKAGTTVVLTVLPIAVLINVSRQILADAEFDATADVMDDFVEALNFRLDFTAFQGSGVSDATNGGFSGLFNSGTAALAAAGNITVEKTQFEDWTRCLTTVDSVVLQRAALWWMHPYMVVRALSVKDANGRPIFMNALEAPASGKVGSILGFPVSLVQAAPTANTINSKVAAFGDPGSYVVGIRQDFEFGASDDFRWNTWERSFRGVGRAACKVRRATGSAILTLPPA